MRWWRKVLAVFGLSNDARINVRASDIEVVITGDRELVHAVLEVVRVEIERLQLLKKRRATLAPGQGLVTDSLIVPTELDDMDSPYAIPEHRVAEDSGSGLTPTPQPREDLETLPTKVGQPDEEEVTPSEGSRPPGARRKR